MHNSSLSQQIKQETAFTCTLDHTGDATQKVP